MVQQRGRSRLPTVPTRYNLFHHCRPPLILRPTHRAMNLINVPHASSSSHGVLIGTHRLVQCYSRLHPGASIIPFYQMFASQTSRSNGVSREETLQYRCIHWHSVRVTVAELTQNDSRLPASYCSLRSRSASSSNSPVGCSQEAQTPSTGH